MVCYGISGVVNSIDDYLLPLDSWKHKIGSTVACVAGVWKGKGKGVLGTRERRERKYFPQHVK